MQNAPYLEICQIQSLYSYTKSGIYPNLLYLLIFKFNGPNDEIFDCSITFYNIIKNNPDVVIMFYYWMNAFCTVNRYFLFSMNFNCR